MPPPDQLPLKIGETYYLKRFSAYRSCTLRSLTSTPGFPDTARVDYYVMGEPVLCRQSELLASEQYQAVMKQRSKEAQRLKARGKYAELITLWEQGRRLHDLVKLWDESPMVVGKKIAAARRWQLIE